MKKIDNYEESLVQLKIELEKKGVKFSDYYGAIIYESGPYIEEFFESSNEGTFTLQVLTVPTKYIIQTVDQESLYQALAKIK